MIRRFLILLLTLIPFGAAVAANADNSAGTISIKGSVVDPKGKPAQGIMVTAFDPVEDKSVSVFTHDDGKFAIPGVAGRDYQVRARLIGLEDEYQDVAAKDAAAGGIKFSMRPADDLNSQRPSVDRIGLLKFASEEHRNSFRFTCGYCHQIGSNGFRAPDQLVDWEVMVTQVMASPDAQGAFNNLHKDLKPTISKMLYETFGGEAEAKWPAYTPPPAPSGEALDVMISEWPLGMENAAMMHDLELGSDGLTYTIDSQNDALFTLDPKTSERKMYPIPGGKVPFTETFPVKAPHSIEEDHDGNMWITLCYGREMARFNLKSKEWLLVPSGAKGKKGMYPHTLRFDRKNVCWYTDAATNSIFRLDPRELEISQYQLLRSNEAVNVGGMAERGGIVPYGMSIAPDGMVWYTKLNGNRVGRIDPATGKITEWKPPVVGPRRLEVAADGIVWIPGCVSGNFCKYNPKTDEWKVYDLPGGGEEFPYALSVHPQTGDIWICGAESDTLMRFHPDTEKMTVYRLPSHVTYTRELEFDKDGSVWTCNSNLPVRHTELRKGALIKLTVLPKGAIETAKAK